MGVIADGLAKHKRRGRLRRKAKVKTVMGEFRRGTLRSGSKSGPKVKSRSQALAIAMSEARKY